MVYKTIDEAICNYIDSIGSSKYKGEKKSWAASSLGSCKRLQFLQRMNIGESNTKPYKWSILSLDGNASHEWRQEVFKKLGICIMDEYTLSDSDYNLYGRLDNVIMLNGVMTLIDIKNQGDTAYKGRKNKVDKKNKRQLVAYYEMIKKNKDKIKTDLGIDIDIKDVRLYYINKSTGERQEFQITITDKDIEDYYNELKLLNEYWSNKTIPPAEKEYVFCNKVCQYRDLCDKCGTNSFKKEVLDINN